MSGGVDSSLAAAMMLERGFDVVGVTIKTHNYEDVGGNDNRDSSCCSLDGINMARIVSRKLDIPHYVFDFSDRFRSEVIDGFVSEYLAGRTPNPCVVCNQKIKWEYLLEKADALDADFICTGHYARLRFDASSGRYILSRGTDTSKDQSYALYGLSQSSLARTVFPLSAMTKPQVRDAAAKLGLASASKPESYEICFVADNNYARFLRDYVPGIDSTLGGGEVRYKGETIGKHNGYPFYTIGQRKGLGVSNEMPLYVRSINPGTNVLEVDVERSLYASRFTIERLNFVKYPVLECGSVYTTKIRYKDSGAECVVRSFGDSTMELEFTSPRRAITPGQSAVLYEGDDIVGGGIISRVIG